MLLMGRLAVILITTGTSLMTSMSASTMHTVRMAKASS